MVTAKVWIEDTREHPIMDINNDRHLVNLENIKTVRTYEEKYGKKCTLEQLIDEIKKINLEKALAKISIASANLVKNNVPYDENRIITRNNLAFLAKLFAYYSAISSGIEPQDEKMSELCLMYNSLCSEDISFKDDDAHIKLGEYFIRNIEATGEVCNLRYDLPRAVVLYSEIAAQEEFKKILDIKESFREITELDVKEYIYSGLGFASVFQHGYTKTKDSIIKEAHKKVLPYLLKFIEYNSIDIGKFRTENCEDDINNLYSFNPLLNTPLLEISKGNFACPIYPFLHAKISNGIYFILFDRHKEDFSKLFGKIFEKYAGKILLPHFGKESLFSEREYALSRKNKCQSVDWSVKEGHWLTLIECKIKRLRHRQTKETGKLEYLDEDLSQGVIKGLIQLNRVIKDIKENKDAFPEFMDVHRYIPTVLLLDRCYLGNSTIFKRRINKLLNDQGVIFDMPYHILDIMELEAILPTAMSSGKRKNLRGFIQKKENSGRYKHESFWNYLCYESPRGIKINKQLRKEFDQIWKEAIAFIFKKDSKK